MFSMLPDLTPRDSHSLWYTSSRNPNSNPSHLDISASSSSAGQGHENGGHTSNRGNNGTTTDPRSAQGSNLHQHHGGGSSAGVIERSVLGRLRADEIYMERRRANVGNMGSTWLKPPGVSKTLFQLREERREAEEHAEAIRREMLAQELAEAEAAEAGNAVGPDGAMVLPDADGDEQMLEDEDDMRDLDEDIPDADEEGGFGFDGASDDGEEEEEEESVGEEEDEEEEMAPEQREMASIRATEDRHRERLARGGGGGQGGGAGDLYGADEDIDEEDQAHMLEEDDLAAAVYPNEVGPGEDMDMEANLDDDIPEAVDESGMGYEHTDSEASLSSSEDDGNNHNVSYASTAVRARHQVSSVHRQRSSMAGRSGGNGAPRSSLDISSILSRDGSSVIGSSPQVRRRN
ncbi:Apc15p protein-domain-containing protein [Podospora didyma]|uniref:Apc15p protein-domain-containing protein n=1 Tax=Podospora didyma TaxID=330526 RepID=A0AAE0NTX8_9PEZI|nr:Apc15p protein-domain-containing protein [Podospora didyma]